MRFLSVCDGVGAVPLAWHTPGASIRIKSRDSNRGHADPGLAAGRTVAPALDAIADEPVLDERCSPDTELTGCKEKEVIE